MSLEKCPKCNKNSLIKKPGSKIMSERFGSLIHTGDKYSMNCLDKDCKYYSGIITTMTKIGNEMKKSWYKRIF